MKKPVYRFARWVFRNWWTRLYGFKSFGWELVPAQSGCLIVCNHVSFMDAGAIGTGLPHREVRFLSKEELFRRPWSRMLLRAWGAFPVARGAHDGRSMETAIELLRAGEVVGMFPEGTRSRNGQMGEWHIGLAVMASAAQVPIIPTAVINTHSTLEVRHGRPGGPPVHIRYGTPITVGPNLQRADLESVRTQARDAVAAMLAEMAQDRN